MILFMQKKVMIFSISNITSSEFELNKMVISQH